MSGLELAMLIGLPGAGKSTFYAQRLAATHAHVSMDALPRGSDKRRRQRHLVEEAFAAGRSVAVDNVNATRSNRAELFALAASAGARVVGYWLDALPGDCAGRNKTRGDKPPVPPAAIFGFAKRFEPPTLEEGFAALWRVGTCGSAEKPSFELRRVAG